MCADDLAAGGAYLFDAERAVLSLSFTDLCAGVGSLIRRAGEVRP